MTSEQIVIDGERFDSVQPSEDVLEGLLRTFGTELFDGYAYYDFRPPVPSRFGTRHPDGVLVAPGSVQWWIVEVELHTHDVVNHIAPQLAGLAEGLYGWEAFSYLDRYPTIDLADFTDVDVWAPSFLLICDLVTPQIRQAADRTNFEVLECATYRSMQNRYALALSGVRPRRLPGALPAGVDVRLREAHGMALLVPLGGRGLPFSSQRIVVLGDQEVRLRRTTDGTAFVLPLSPSQVQDLVGAAECYRMTADQRLLAADPSLDTTGPEEAHDDRRTPGK